MQVDTGEDYYVAGKMLRTRLDKETEESVEELTSIATLEIGEDMYKSNENRILFGYESAKITMTSENEGEEVKYGEEINYKITIKNTGRTNVEDTKYAGIVVDLKDLLPEGIDPISVTYDNWEQKIIIYEDESCDVLDEFIKKDPVTENIEGIMVEDEEGNDLYNFNIQFVIPYKESVTIEVKTKAGFVYEKTKVENKATVTGEYIQTKNSNMISHTILPYNYEEKEEPGNPENPDPVDPDNPENPENPDKPDDPNKPKNKGKIEGVVWIDENEDGRRQEDEKLQIGVNTILVNLENTNEIKAQIKTNANGKYEFSNLEKGNYIVLFQYDTSNYKLTECRKSGVPNEVNSDAISKGITLNGQTINVGMIEINNLETTVTNMDVGLIKNKISDLKLDKFIQKVTVKTKNGTKQYDDKEQKLAKIEIKAKEIEGAIVTVHYKMVITNQGEIPVSVDKIVDKLPDGLKLDTKASPNWKVENNGQISSNIFSNRKIEVGESKEISLVATKTLTEDTIGSFKNVANIEIKDSNQDNNRSEAELILSVSTGLMVYLSIGTILIVVILVAVFLSYKYGILKVGKISLFAVILVFTIITNTSIVKAVEPPQYANFTYDENNQLGYVNSQNEICGFLGGSVTGPAKCTDQPLGPWTGLFRRGEWGEGQYSSTRRSLKKKADVDFNLSTSNSDIEMKISGSNAIFGPFKFYCNYYNSETGYQLVVYNGSGGKITNYTICNANGTAKTLSGTGNLTFYLKIPTSTCKNGVSKVEITNTKKDYNEYNVTKTGQPLYCASFGAGRPDIPGKQRIFTIKTFTNTTTEKDANPTVNTKKISWTNIRGSLQIIKQDADNANKKLSGVKIRVTASGYDKTFTTDANGKIVIENLSPNKTYTITEVSTPNYGYVAEAKASKTVGTGAVVTCTLSNTKYTGNLRIEKKDPDSTLPLKNISFKLKDASGKYVIVKNSRGVNQTTVIGKILLGGMTTTTSIGSATEFITDTAGIVEIHNILTGTYQVVETSVGSNSDYYEIDDNYISWSGNNGSGTGRTASIKVTRQTSYETDTISSSKYNILNVKNRRKYVKYSGYVWENKPWDENKQTQNNLLYNENEKDKNDRVLKDIKVQLKDKNGKVLQEKITDSNGSYLFEKVLIDEISNYYIEFEYNGMRYQNILQTTNKEKGSKASEGSNRTKYNQEYSTIMPGKSNAHELTYETSDYKSNLLYRKDKDKSKYKYGYNENASSGDPVSGVDAQYIIKANTVNVYNGYLNLIQSEANIRKNAIEQVKNINLGIERREKTDLSLVKDINNAKVSINTVDHVYRYADRFNSSLYGDNGTEGKSPYQMDPQVRFGSKYGSMSYTRALYPSDVYYNDTSSKKDAEGVVENNLRVRVTYQIGIKNTSTLKTVVNQIDDYYNEKYYNAKAKVIVGKQINERGEIITSSQIPYDIVNSGNSGYYKIQIKNLNMELNGSAEGTIYVQLEVKQDRIREIVETNQTGDVKLDNIAEIISYSCKDKNNAPYASFDQDSAPGNVNLNNAKTYEDDTDKAPGLKLVLQEQRKTDGKVFMDNPLENNGFKAGNVNTGKDRQGSGIYENGEKGIKGVTVELINKRLGTVADIYDTNTKTWKKATKTTDDNGDFYFEGFIPDEYELVYTWGGQEDPNKKGQDKPYIRVQDYKATIYKDKTGGLEWYKQVNPRYSDAKDDYNTRVAIDNQSKLITNRNKDVLYNYTGQIELENGTKQNLITTMKSTTPRFKVNLEYKTEPTKGMEKHVNHLQNMDFGIIERAKQALELTKKVKRVRLVLANGTVLVDATVGENGGINNEVRYTTYIPKSVVSNGQVKLEIDNEIIQSARLEVEYKFKVRNISEKEYLSESYYTYGIGHGESQNQLVALNANTVIDYMDNNLAKNVEELDGWEVYDAQQKMNLVEQQGLIAPQLKTLLTQTNTVLNTNRLSTDLRPEGITQTETTLKVYRMLPSNIQDEDSEMGNDAEIIKIIKTGGSSLTTIPGNYVPSEGVKEVDEAKSETVTIIPPTGRITNYIAYTLLSISSLGILVSGIILIKKFVLK